MDVNASLDAPCPPDRLRQWVDDLERYPAWLSIVPRAEREAAVGHSADPDLPGALDAPAGPGGSGDADRSTGSGGVGDGDSDGDGDGSADTDEPPAWSVELRATLGPLARSKRLRMVRTVDEADHLRFERRETDGREHSPWVLDATIVPLEGGAASRLVMNLHYGGSFGGNLLERLLGDEIERSKPCLLDLVSDPA
ncbi:hypothetical protein [Rhabdothermincola salaria]|uniref:hypothetical protein n=1 Tax=Rhabdothermincola salaria TaxID=2903142 RepID=UPI001E5A8324|nr:hypothetical protein [Rhabdothermincola salaria]MCD9622818.1 hypothetical protein [Rhabdothermincola salaria]